MRKSVAEGAQHRIAALILGDGDERRIGLADRMLQLRHRRCSVEHQRLEAPGEPCTQQGRAFGAAHRADDARKAVAVTGDIMLRRIAEAET